MTEQNIRLSMLDLEVGESRQTICPFCNAEHERSLGATRLPTGLVYQCWRAKCKAKGFIASSATNFDPHWEKNKRKIPNPKPFQYDTITLPEQFRRMFYDKYDITEDELQQNGFLYSSELNRVVMPIFNSMGYQVGSVARSYSHYLSGSKVINYFDDGKAHLHYPPTIHNSSKSVVLVEDIPSAIRVGRQARSVALLGHSLCDETAEDLADNATDLIVALDPDAVDKALKLKKQWQIYFNSIVVRVLSSDPKDMSDEQIYEEILS